MRCPLKKMLSAQYSTVNYRHIVVQQIARNYLPFLSETLCILWIAILHFPLLITLGNVGSSTRFPCVWLFYMPHVSGIIQYSFSCDCLVSLSKVSSRVVHVVTCDKVSFFLNSGQYPSVCVYITRTYFFLYLSNNGCLDCFHTLATVRMP